ncbi:MAG TPA: hypothetical protein VH415_06505 [Nitrososphaeraceae archaeon]|jgi:hypothetical protein
MVIKPHLSAFTSEYVNAPADTTNFVAAVWASPEKVPFISVPTNIVLKETNSLPPPITPGPFSMSDENNLKNLYEESGFIHPTVERMNIISNFDSTDEFTTFTVEHGGPNLRKILAGQTKERREQIKAISKGTESCADDIGKVTFENEAMLIVGRK